MKQKFRQLSSVHVCKDMPQSMSHFPSDFDAIVAGTYSQLCSGDNIDSYQVYRVENGKVVTSIAWYRESQLTQIEGPDSDTAEEMIEDYNMR